MLHYIILVHIYYIIIVHLYYIYLYIRLYPNKWPYNNSRVCLSPPTPASLFRPSNWTVWRPQRNVPVTQSLDALSCKPDFEQSFRPRRVPPRTHVSISRRPFFLTRPLYLRFAVGWANDGRRPIRSNFLVGPFFLYSLPYFLKWPIWDVKIVLRVYRVDARFAKMF